MVARFNGRNPRAETWLRDQSSWLIKRVSDDAKESARVVLEAGMRAGRGPRSVALDVVGRIDKVTKRRVGGPIGMLPRDMETAQRAFDELRSASPSQLKRYLKRKLRDRRFDSVVKKAIREGRAVPAEQARKMVAKYEDRLLFKRGETIARTELMRSLHSAQDEAMQQLIDDEKLSEDMVTRIWDSAEDNATRPDHRDVDGQKRDGEGFFKVGGYKMRYPGDSEFGAPASEIINCRCVVRVKLDFITGLRARTEARRSSGRSG